MPHKVLITDYYYPTWMKSVGSSRRPASKSVMETGACKTPEDVIALGEEADAIITQFRPITRGIIERLRRCKVIVRYAIGVDTIDIPAATNDAFMVANVPDYCIAEVSDHALALIMALVRKVKVMDAEVQRGTWAYRRAVPVRRLGELTLGLIGFGHIGPGGRAEGARPRLRPRLGV